jgi:hypothetical protein
MNARNQPETIPDVADIIWSLLEGSFSMNYEQLRTEIEDAARRFAPANDQRLCEMMAILVTSIVIGADENRIMHVLGLPEAKVREAAANLRNYGVWEGGQVPLAYWLEPGSSFINLCLDGRVATGELARGLTRRLESLGTA